MFSRRYFLTTASQFGLTASTLQPEDWLDLEHQDFDLDPRVVDLEFIEDSLPDLDNWQRRRLWLPMDNEYQLISEENFNKIINVDDTNTEKGVAEWYDCEDYMFSITSLFRDRFHVNNVGMAITYAGEPHAYNIVVFKDGTVKKFEPQLDRFVTDNELDIYDLDDGVVLF